MYVCMYVCKYVCMYIFYGAIKIPHGINVVVKYLKVLQQFWRVAVWAVDGLKEANLWPVDDENVPMKMTENVLYIILYYLILS